MEEERRDGPTPGERPRLTRRDVLALVLQAYRTTFPYVLVFVLLMSIATWVVTTVFR